jgi:UDP-3-O-[3-hydroxymyristoyl] glucosamine N-acyltransferase LpxD
MRESNVLRATLSEAEIRRVIGLPGEGTLVVDGLAPLTTAADRCLYFVNKPITESTRESLATLRDCIVIVRTGSAEKADFGKCLVLEVANPRSAIAKILQFIMDHGRQRPWLSERKVDSSSAISPLAVVQDRVEIGPGAVIEPFCVVENDVSIGRGSVIRSGARVHSRVVIGEETVVGVNSVIGHQGFGFVRDERGKKRRIPHLGGVVIGSHVEIGALVTVPSGTIGPTIIEDGAKVDDHVHVGHNVRVARGASVTAAVVIGGSVTIAEEAWVGINSSIRDGRRVGSRSLVGMDASVQQDLPDNAVARAPRPDVTTRSDDDGDSIGFS